MINSSLAGVYKTARDRGARKVYGMLHGIQGLLQERYVDLEEHIKSDLDIELLKRTPSAYLGSCRFKLPEICDDREIYDKIFSMPPFRSIIAGLPGTGIGFEIITYIQPVSVIIYHFLARNR